MPYIKQEDREKFTRMLLETPSIVGSGELNYLFTKIYQIYIMQKGLNYQTLNDIKGVFGCCSDEFTRRVVNPYEDKKIAENGDV